MKSALVVGINPSHFRIDAAGLRLFFSLPRLQLRHFLGGRKQLQGLLGQRFDALPGITFRGVDQGVSIPGLEGSAGTSHPVDIVLWIARNRTIDHHPGLRDINASAGHIGAHEASDFARPKQVQGIESCILPLVAVEGPDPSFEVGFEVGRQRLCLGFLAYKYHSPVPGMGPIEQLGHHPVLGGFIGDLHFELSHACSGGSWGGDLQPLGPQEELVRQALHLRWKGGTEEEVLSLSGNEFLNLTKLGHEPHVHHAVCFIQNHVTDPLRVHSSPLVEFQVTTGRGYHQILTRHEISQLRFVADATKKRQDAQLRMLGELHCLCMDLEDQFFGRSQHQCPRLVSLRKLEHLKQREQKGSRLSGAGLGDGNQILSRKQNGDGPLLNGGRFLIASIFYGA